MFIYTRNFKVHNIFINYGDYKLIREGKQENLGAD
jgi:hypothetical protein